MAVRIKDPSLKKIAIELIGLKPKITASDRKGYAQRFNSTLPNVSNYLAGKVSKMETGLSMLEYFTERVSEREKSIDKIIEKKHGDVETQNEVIDV